MSSGIFKRSTLGFGLQPGEALVFAYCPKQHGMVRVRVPDTSVETTEAFYRDRGFEVSSLRSGHGSKS
jgi:hypothetical protein